MPWRTRIITKALKRPVAKFEFCNRLIEHQKQRRDPAQKKKSKLPEDNVTGQPSDTDFLAMNEQCSDEIKDTETQIHELEQQLFSREGFRKHMDAIRATLKASQRDAAQGMVSQAFVDKYIDRILSPPKRMVPFAWISRSSPVK